MSTHTTKSHRDMYPDQYTHELVGRRVQIRHTGEEKIVERVVQSRFGPLCMFAGSTTAYGLADVKATNRWTWSVKGPGVDETGQTTGVDPRDAVSRTFTSDRGTALAQRLAIGIDIIDDAPGNGDASYQCEYGMYTVRVQRDESLSAEVAPAMAASIPRARPRI